MTDEDRAAVRQLRALLRAPHTNTSRLAILFRLLRLYRSKAATDTKEPT